ncbi:MAG: prepilin-type N-terminal cleavage/methylation domain-containing protein [Candidatus Zixiibacteriota bacterium]
MKLNEKGLSLLEVLVSMLLLALGLLALAPMVVISIEGNNISRDVLTVSEMAKEKIEFYKGLDPFPPLPYAENESNVYGGYNRSTSILDNASDTTIPDGLYKVLVSISWTDKSGVARSTNYSTYIGK